MSLSAAHKRTSPAAKAQIFNRIVETDLRNELCKRAYFRPPNFPDSDEPRRQHRTLRRAVNSPSGFYGCKDANGIGTAVTAAPRLQAIPGTRLGEC